MATFKVKDLMINVIPDRLALGGGGLGLCTQDQASADHTPITPWTPVISVAKLTPRFDVVEKLEHVEAGVLDQVAHDAGRAALGGKVTALCMQDQATCDANPAISPVASGADFLRVEDLPQLKLQLREAAAAIEKVENVLEERSHREARSLVPRLEAAVEVLRRH